MSYIAGEGYDKGYKSRMSGGYLPPQANGGSSDPYWQEFATGWRDADTKIIQEARSRNNTTNESVENKRFIQD